MLFNSYTSVSRLINTEPSELLRLQLSEPIASESGRKFRGLVEFLYQVTLKSRSGTTKKIFAEQLEHSTKNKNM